MNNDIFKRLKELEDRKEELTSKMDSHYKIKGCGYGFPGGWILDLLDDEEREYAIIENEINEIKGKIKQYSSFKPEVIGNVLATLVSKIEEESYVYDDYFLRFTQRVMKEYGEDDTLVYYYAHMIRKEDNVYKYSIEPIYSSPNVVIKDMFPEEIILGYEEETKSDNYKIDFYDDSLKRSIKIDDYEYVYEFIDYVINYAIDNDIQSLDEAMLMGLVDEYIKIKQNNKESIMVKRRKEDGKKD